MTKNKSLIALDVGEKRIGVAVADGSVRIAVPYDTFLNDGTAVERISELVLTEGADTVVVGYPRNQSGEATAQTAYVEAFVELLSDLDATIKFQDESLTSVMAEERLKAQKAPYEKGDIDAMAASIILQDYIEAL